MNDKPRKPGNIERPKDFPAANARRRAAKAIGGAVPGVGSLIAEAADAFISNPEAQDRNRWEGEVTDEVNTLGGRVDNIDQRTGNRTESLSVVASAIAKYMIESCPDGLGHRDTTLTDIHAAYPDLEKADLLDGLGDLESFGLINTTSFIGAPDEYQLTGYAYEVLDPPVMGWNPKDDARALAALIVRDRTDTSSHELESSLGWPRRRFNPALRIVAGYIRLVGKELQPNYITTHLYPTNAEFSNLRRFASDGKA